MKFMMNDFISSRFTRYFLGGCIFLFIGSCTPDSYQKLDSRAWSLVWSDEFDGQKGGAPNPSNWSFDIGTGTDGWGNQELQFYTQRSENIALDGQGYLLITARKESFSGRAFTSARIHTKGKFQHTYGRVEARIKTPHGPGIWPAFWMLGHRIDVVGWPNSGEIDIMEMRGQEPSIIYGSLHGPGYSGGNAISGYNALQNGRYDTDFYLYAIEWYPDRIDFFVNDYLYQRVYKRDVRGEWVFDDPFYLVLNVAVGGNYVGFPNDKTPFPQVMMIDYVRVYQ
jgi:beta-glucanase (GH16 family)